METTNSSPEHSATQSASSSLLEPSSTTTPEDRSVPNDPPTTQSVSIPNESQISINVHNPISHSPAQPFTMADTPLTVSDLKDYYDKYNQFNGIKIDLAKKLDHKNYKKWLQEFGSSMRYYKIWTILKDDYSPEAKAQRVYKDMNETAWDMLYNNVGPFYQQIMESEKSARDAFVKISQHFEGNPLVQTIRLMTEFADRVQERSEDLEQSLIYFKNFKADLELLHKNLPDSLLIGLLVTIVPKANQDTTKELMLTKNKDITFIEALNLYQNSVQLKREFEDNRPMKSICAIVDKSKVICIYCQAKGHSMSMCRKLEADKASGKINGDILVYRKPFDKNRKGNGKKQVNDDKSAPPAGQTAGATDQTENNSKKTRKRGCAIISNTSSSSLNPRKWYIDTGAEEPGANSLTNCVHMVYQHSDPLYTAGNNPLHVSGIGKFVFTTKQQFEFTINNVNVCEGLAANFLSYSALDDAGYTLTGGNGMIYIWDGDECILSAKRVGKGLYEIEFDYDSPPETQCTFEGNDEHNENDDFSACFALLNAYEPDQDTEYWHETLNHANIKQLQRLAERLNLKVTGDLKCLICKLAKLVKMPFFKRLQLSSTGPLQLIHSDLSGIIRIYNPEGFRYFVNFQDDYTKFTVTFLLSRKYQVFDAFKQFKEHMELQTGLKVLALRSDNGGEYASNAFEDYLVKNGIKRQFTIAYNPQMNANAERINRTYAEAARAALIGRNLSLKFWAKSILAISFVKNRIPHAGIDFRIPYEEMFGKKVDFNKLKPFGHPVVVLDLHPESKFHPKSKPALFMGYPDNTSGYEIYLTEEKKFAVARDVHFLSKREIKDFNVRFGDQIPQCENPELLKRLNHFDNENSGDRFLDDPMHQSCAVTDDYDDNVPDIAEQISKRPPKSSSEPTAQNPNEQAPRSPNFDHDANNSFENLDHDTSQQIADQQAKIPIKEFDSIGENPPNGRYILNRIQRQKIKQKFPNAKITFDHVAPHATAKKNNRKCVWDVRSYVNSIAHRIDDPNALPFVPRNFRQAMSCKDGLLWKVAADEEYDSLLRNEVFQLVERPDGSTRILPGMWLFKVKLDEFGRVTRYKARYVILGNRQLLVSGNTYSPVVNSLSLRILLAIAVYLGLDVHHVDVKTAYLHAELNEPVFMKQPEGYVKEGEEHLVCKLSKAIYGLRSSAKEWFSKLTNVLSECGLQRLFTDECIFSNGQIGERMLVVACYVDDLILIGQLDQVEKLKLELVTHFSITDKGRISDCLGMQFSYDLQKGEMEIRQTKYAQEMLFKFGLKDCNPAKTPLSDGDLFAQSDKPITDIELYRSIVGSLLYLANNSRPDIAYAIGVLSRFASKPTKVHLEAAKRTLRYVKGTVNSRIIYRKGGVAEVVVLSDSDLARDVHTSVSVSGVCSFVAGCIVGWSSFKQTRVAQSTCEAEVLSVLDGVNELEYIRDFLNELKLKEFVDKPSDLFNDNQGCLSSTQDGGAFKRNKHYRIRLNRVRRAIEDGLCTMKYRSTDTMIADALTKPLGFEKSACLWKSANVRLITA